LNPVSLYAQLKIGFEEYLFNLNQPDFYPTCLRFATAYGLSPRPRFDLTVNEFTRELVLNRQLEVYGEKFWRPYCHTVDLARACVAVIEADPDLVVGRAFNVGDSNENYQKKTITEIIIGELPDRINDVKYVHRTGDPRNYRVNFELIEKTLDFKVTRNVIDGIREIIFAIDSGVIKDPDDKFFKNR